MLNENYILKDKNYLSLILFIFVMIFFQNLHFNNLTNQNQELINLNKEILSSYKDLIDNHIRYSEDICYVKSTAEHLEKQNGELLQKTEKLNDLFFNQTDQ
ncbi:MAG TPA: hypothetical protein VFF25_00900 [Clostridia bacterium]|nr:hypothetical protein [Clostridia bacterium]